MDCDFFVKQEATDKQKKGVQKLLDKIEKVKDKNDFKSVLSIQEKLLTNYQEILSEEYFQAVYPEQAKMCYTLGDVKNALLYANKALPLLDGQEKSDIYVVQAQSYFDLGNIQAALQSCDDALEFNSSMLEVYLMKAAILISQKRFEEAIVEYNLAIKYSDKEEKLLCYIERGICYRKLNEHDKALRDLKKVVKDAPYYNYVYAEIALVFYDKKNYKKALEYFNKAIDEGYHTTKSYHARANIYDQLGMSLEAEKDRERSQEIRREKEAHFSPDEEEDFFRNNLMNGDPIEKLVSSLEEMLDEDPKAAIQAMNIMIEDAERTATKEELVTLVLLLIEVLNDAKEYTAAIDLLSKAQKLEPLNFQIYSLRASIYRSIAEYELCLKDLDKSIQLGANKPMVLACKSDIFRSLGRDKEALDSLDKAIKMDDSNSNYYFMRALIHKDHGDYNKSLNDLNSTIKLEPDNPLFYENRADVYELLGKDKEAQKDYDKLNEFGQNMSFEDIIKMAKIRKL